MKIIISYTFLTTLTLLFFACEAKSQNIEPKYGEYEVGFRVIRTTDNSRVYKKIGDQEYGPRPMQIYVWYPAKKSNNETVTLEDYMVLGRTEETLAKPSDADFASTLRMYSRVTGLDEEKTKELLAYNYKSKHEPTVIDGKFPLILYGAAQTSSGFGNIRLCEQLASYGYVVVSVASKNYFSRQMPLNSEGAQAQTRDLEFVYGVMHDFPFVDTKQVGVFGFSFGGMNIIPFSLKNRTVKALVALDGSLSAGYKYLEQFPNLDLNNLNSNFLGFLGDKDNIDTHKLNNEAALLEIYLIEVKNLVHYDFSSSNLMMGKKPKYKYDFYTDIANMKLKFFDMNLKGNDQFKDAFDNSSKSIYRRVKKIIPKNQPKVLKEDFIDYTNKEGIDKATEVYYLTKSDFPDYKLFDYDPFRDVGFLFFINEDYTNAIKAYEVLLDAYPDEDDSYRRLGETYMLVGKFKESRVLLEKGLKINPASLALNDILRILTEKKGELKPQEKYYRINIRII